MDIENSPGARVHPAQPAARDDYGLAKRQRAARRDAII
jgi:hypothetical protein